MPNPATLHHRSIKIDHHLKIVDFYIHMGLPVDFKPEPAFPSYKPDVYMKDQKGNPICVEIQITKISAKKMQTKVDEFVKSYGKKEHDAKILLVVTDSEYNKLVVPSGFKIYKIPMPLEPYAQKSTL